MNILNYYYKNLTQYDLINKFLYNQVIQIPKFKKIILSFNITKFNLKLLTSSLVALELISLQQAIIIKTSRSNAFLKIKKGSPIGCKVTLRKNNMFNFLFKISPEVLFLSKHFTTTEKSVNKQNINFNIKNILVLPELEHHFFFFRNLPNFNLTIVTNSNNFLELKFIRKSIKF